MNIYNNIKNFLYDHNNFVCILDNSLYLYNVLSIEEVSDTKMVVLFNNKKVSIYGSNIKVIKSINKELELTLNLERIINESIN